MLRLGESAADTPRLAQAMRSRGAPLDVIEFQEEAPRDLYGCDLLLVRPDLHVAWRGNRAPENAERVAAVVTGHAADGESAGEQ